MSPERARQVANGILTVAGVTLAVIVWRQPALRRLVRRFAPIALREIRPVHIAAAMAAIATAPAAAAGAVVAADGLKPDEDSRPNRESDESKPLAEPGALS